MNRADPETATQFEMDSTQMAFSVAGSRSLELSIDKPAEEVCDFLSYHVARQPGDLLAHVQRIKHAASHGLEQYLHGALLDLFIFLGTRGEELRTLMLKQAKGVLSNEQLTRLTEKLADGFDAHDAIDNPGISVLSLGIDGRTDFIDETAVAEARQLNPLEQALTSIEISQLDEARSVLEDSVLAGTSTREQQELLLDLYRKTSDHIHFATLYANLSDEQNHVPEAWRALQSHFDDSA